MKDLKKIATRQDSYFKLSPSLSNETSINLSNEISTFISDESREVTFTIYREDFVKAISALCLMPRIYKKKEQIPSTPFEILSELYNLIEVEFGDSDTSEYTIYHFKRDDGRFYLNNLKLKNGFNLRSFLVEQLSLIHFIKNDDGQLTIRIETRLPGNDIERIEVIPSFDEIKYSEPLQQIFFGAPGTGKSNEIKKLTGEGENGVKFDKDSTFRITFHPDSDYASFVGAYKPIWNEEKGKIIYEFRPQPFLKAYTYAWKNPDKNVALIIEEINRGNCAQIFGDIFQLLDRDEDGMSKYPIEADDDMHKFLKKSFDGEYDDKAIGEDDKDAINFKYSKHYDNAFDKIKLGSILSLPKNLSILATMNTSDQSLFPMDSAFKRRWDWEYMPIKNAGLNWKIELDDKHKLIDWWDFLERINKEISELTTSEDKQLGYFFCQPDKFTEPNEIKRADGAEYDLISAKKFVDKVIFYLWNDVFKDYAYESKCCKDSDSKVILFAQFYGKDGKTINKDVLAHFFRLLTAENEKSLVKLKETDTSTEEEKTLRTILYLRMTLHLNMMEMKSQIFLVNQLKTSNENPF